MTRFLVLSFAAAKKQARLLELDENITCITRIRIKRRTFTCKVCNLLKKKKVTTSLCQRLKVEVNSTFCNTNRNLKHTYLIFESSTKNMYGAQPKKVWRFYMVSILCFKLFCMDKRFPTW